MLYTLVITTIVTFVVWYAQYRWKRRRLNVLASRINGPLTLPFIGNALHFARVTLGSTFDYSTKLVQDYKSPARVWIGPELLIIMWKPNQIEAISNNPHTLEKPEAYSFIKMIFGNGIATADVPTWKRHRKVIMPTLNQSILINGFVQVFAEQGEILVEQLQKVVGKGEFDIYNYVSRCALDTFCETSMGITINAQSTDCEYMRWVNRLLEIFGKLLWTYWFRNDFLLKYIPIGREMFELDSKVDNFTDAVVKEKLLEYQKKLGAQSFYEEDNKKRKTFLETLIESSEKASVNFTDVQLRDEVETFMFAGSHTTATMVTFIFLLLGMFSEVQDEVYREVLEVLGPKKAVEWTDMQNFVYLERVLKEAMRLFPSAPIIGRLASQDVELDNCVIPAGSTIGILLLDLHRDPETWPDPLKFDPDRFLPEEIGKRHPYSWLPFAGGPRNCVGIKYAMMLIKTLTATVIRKYKISTAYKKVEDVELKFDMVLRPAHGYKLSMELRNPQ